MGTPDSSSECYKNKEIVKGTVMFAPSVNSARPADKERGFANHAAHNGGL